MALLADLDPDEAQSLGTPARALARTRAVAKANAYLKDSGTSMVAAEDLARFNPVQRLWIVPYRDPAHPDEMLVGGGPVIVPEVGPVYEIDSLPHAPEYNGMLSFQLPVDWSDVIADAMTPARWNDLQSFVAAERATHTVYPAATDVFRAFELTPFEETRVVILGQDPYHTPGHATGLAFSVPDGTMAPPSLRTILNELRDDLGVTRANSLDGWAAQGVLLLNTALTVRAGAPNSHARQWQIFTDTVIRAISDREERVVFVLWGQDAQRRKRLITTTRHPVIAAAHPAARANALAPLRGSRPFSRINELVGGGPIDWSRP